MHIVVQRQKAPATTTDADLQQLQQLAAAASDEHTSTTASVHHIADVNDHTYSSAQLATTLSLDTIDVMCCRRQQHCCCCCCCSQRGFSAADWRGGRRRMMWRGGHARRGAGQKQCAPVCQLSYCQLGSAIARCAAVSVIR